MNDPIHFQQSTGIVQFAFDLRSPRDVDAGQFKNLRKFCQGALCEFPEPYDSDAYRLANVEQRLGMISSDALYKESSNSEKLALLLYRSSNQSGVKALGGRERLMHNKFVLVDQKRLLTGSGNWSSTAVSVNLENLTILEVPGDQKQVGAFSCMFEALWGDSSQRASQVGRCQTSEVFFAPVARGQALITDQIITSIQESRQSVEIAMHHLVHPAVIWELTRAARRGVGVRIVTDDDNCMSKRSAELSDLLRSGAEMRYVPTNCQLFQLAHNKFGVFDQRRVINGSGNWSKAGLERNFENFLIIPDDDVETFNRAFSWMWDMSVSKPECSCNPSESSCRERHCLGRMR